jgi:small GTP-binding protein
MTPRLSIALRLRSFSSARAPPPPPPPPPPRAPPRRPQTYIYSPPPPSATQAAWRAPAADASQRALAVSVVGAPNAGKSTLLNALLGRSVSAVSRKYNTTRRRTLGLLTEGCAQLELVDTPGFVRAEGEGGAAGGAGARYHKALVAAARDAVPESDLVLLVLDAARRFDDEARASLAAMVRLAAASGAGVLLVANKCDLLRGVALDQRQRALAAAVTPRGAGSVGGWAAAVGRPAGAAAAVAAALDGEREDEEEEEEEGEVEGGGGGVVNGGEGYASSAEGAEGAAALGLVPRRLRHLAAARRRFPRRDLLRLKLDVAGEWLEGECRRAGLVGAGGFAAERARGAADRGLGLLGGGSGGGGGGGGGGDDDDDSAPLAASLYRRTPPVFGVAASLGHGIPELRAALLALARPRAWAYGAEAVTDQPLLARVAEAVREQLLNRLHDEVPYRLQQETRSWREVPAVAGAGGAPRAAFTEIHQDIRVPSQRAASMLLANGGAAIKAVAEAARVSVAAILGTRVRLILHVSVKSEDEMRRAAARGLGE